MVAVGNVQERIRDFVQKKTGLVIRGDRYLDLDIVLKNRFTQLGVGGEDYFDYFLAHDDELLYVASQLTIQETCFYRYREHFDWLREILAERAGDVKDRTLTLLSAGCSTGEEP